MGTFGKDLNRRDKFLTLVLPKGRFYPYGMHHVARSEAATPVRKFSVLRHHATTSQLPAIWSPTRSSQRCIVMSIVQYVGF
jgi:hypothetical protein